MVWRLGLWQDPRDTCVLEPSSTVRNSAMWPPVLQRTNKAIFICITHVICAGGGANRVSCGKCVKLQVSDSQWSTAQSTPKLPVPGSHKSISACYITRRSYDRAHSKGFHPCGSSKIAGHDNAHTAHLPRWLPSAHPGAMRRGRLPTHEPCANLHIQQTLRQQHAYLSAQNRARVAPTSIGTRQHQQSNTSVASAPIIVSAWSLRLTQSQ